MRVYFAYFLIINLSLSLSLLLSFICYLHVHLFQFILQHHVFPILLLFAICLQLKKAYTALVLFHLLIPIFRILSAFSCCNSCRLTYTRHYNKYILELLFWAFVPIFRNFSNVSCPRNMLSTKSTYIHTYIHTRYCGSIWRALLCTVVEIWSIYCAF